MFNEQEHKDFLHRQLIKLGDMMGDGLHHEPDGRWIEKEYGQIARQLFPETYAKIDKVKREKVNKHIAELLTKHKCRCGGEFKQVRSGSKTVQCKACKAKAIFKKVKINNSAEG